MAMEEAGCEVAAAAALPGSKPFRVFFIPFFIPTHTIPVTELACQFAARGVEATMVLTPANAALVRAGLPVRVLVYPFPSVEVGLPEGVEDAAPLLTGEVTSIYRATDAVRGAHERILREHRPDAVVADFPFYWMNDITEDLHIPRVFYHVCGAFPTTVIARISQHRPHARLADGDNGPFLVPNLPDRVEMVKSELPSILRVADVATAEYSRKMLKSQQESFGVILNTVYELEPAYVDLFGRTQCRQVWCCGPCTLWPTDDQEQAAAEKSHPCIAWLDKQAVRSVVYAAFGSSLHFSKEQHREMARGLEASGRPFLWAVKESAYAATGDGWLPDEFEDNVRDRGLVVRGWVPQKDILNHPAVGAFVSQLGWNSLTEGLHAGLPIITWPLAFEQFFTERLVVDVLRVGVRMWEGFRSSLPATDQDSETTLVKGEAIARVVSRFAAPGSADEEVEAMRKRGGEYGAMMRAAVREGGSSYKDLQLLIDALKATRTERKLERETAAAPSGSKPFRVFFFPFFIPTHTIPVTALACQFAARGVDATLVLTPANAALVRAGLPVRTLLYPFPSVEVGLPKGVEDAASVMTGELDKIYRATDAVRSAHDRILREHRPDAVVADFPFCWINDIAGDLDIPRVFYHVCGAFPSILIARISEHRPHTRLAEGDNGPFLVPNLPDRLEMVKSELPSIMNVADVSAVDESRKMAKSECFGIILNTVYELEPAYIDLFRQMECRQVWCCGPCTLWPTHDQEPEAAEKNHPCIAWLDKQAATSVVYAAFGSSLHFSKQQHREMARGLEASGRLFLWVVKDSVYAAGGEGWLPEEFEDRVRGRGMVFSGWVPQKAILNHPAVGAFVSQLGWNSLNEGLHAGLPIITWPLAFEQFFTERLVVDVLRVGLRMWEGFRRSLPATEDAEATLVKGEAIARVVSRFAAPGSADEEVEAMRKRAGEYGAVIRAAVREGGSSYKDLESLIRELKATRAL
ncbi:hypothetical protein Taro_037898 [Colocasia esculenta]|uniref:UDP-glycosyltransferases domain-containing protein n=1 Tax=Colocasia esculenta TaxID=4460 RepID=A0A843WHL5_COLES|nr:hypothetical protein [Colocasia esculenta]